MANKKPVIPVKSGSSFQEVRSGSKITTLEFFSEAQIALNKEVLQHPMLRIQLQSEAPSGEEGEVIGTIAAYCNITMDGTYSRERIENLYSILVEKLQKIRMIRLH